MTRIEYARTVRSTRR